MRTVREMIEEVEPDMDIELEDGDIVTDVVVLARVQKLEDTDDCLLIAATKHTGGIVSAGLIHAAEVQHDEWMRGGMDEEDDK